VLEVLDSDYNIIEIVCTQAFKSKYADKLAGTQLLESEDLATLGNFRSNDRAIAVVQTKPNEPFTYRGGLILALDDINDPGNLGTILRIADWYGISGVFASPDTCELYNPKVISASKGSFTRVPYYTGELAGLLPSLSIPVYAADMHGENLHTTEIPKDVCLIMGNEAHGISASLEALIDRRVHIPSRGRAESLNVGVATAVILDNYSRLNPRVP